MKKILLHSNIAWTISNFRLELIKHFISEGYEVVCVADSDSFNNDSSKEIELAGAKFIPISLNRKGLNPIKDLKYLIRIIEVLKKEKPDLTINYTIKPVIFGSIASRWVKIQTIAVISGLGYVFINKGIIFLIVKILYKLSLAKCSKVLFLNDQDRIEFIKSNIVKADKTKVLPGEGINVEFFKSNTSNIVKEKFVFLKICRLLWDKGVREYIEAAQMIISKNKDVEFQLLGFIDENNPSSISRKEIAELEEKGIIKYLGVTNDVRKYIESADCIVLASYREGISRTLLEAASMAKPIITTDVTGCRETIDDQISGLLCKPKNSADLAEKMEKMMQMSQDERNSFGTNGRQKMIKEFDQKIVNKIYDAIISEL